jgi:hypothetical protein
MIATAYRNGDNVTGYIRFNEVTHSDLFEVKAWAELTYPYSYCAWATDLSSLTLFLKNEENYLLGVLRWA